MDCSRDIQNTCGSSVNEIAEQVNYTGIAEQGNYTGIGEQGNYTTGGCIQLRKASLAEYLRTRCASRGRVVQIYGTFRPVRYTEKYWPVLVENRAMKRRKTCRRGKQINQSDRSSPELPSPALVVWALRQPV